ncbi:aminotransferase class V-fold PLP-dependent enzyme [bacterium]|nr:aminotransferase class V-fold PLP-dependent enzyme [bacterium]NBW56174.1 aminotransferase class V-fold PLP-dependent enzyme [bacterium]NBX72259.1 aminotransferase class V-fold PLP-dependent enzyme [bacterium]
MIFNIRNDFPLIDRPPYHPFCYADSASTTQKPYSVIQAVSDHYRLHNANIHRGAYRLSEQATEVFEQARSLVAHYFHANPDGVVFCRSATETLNLLAHSLCQKLQPGEGILLSLLEHHANIVPWQQAAARYGLNIYWLNITNDGVIDEDHFRQIFKLHHIKIVSLLAVSNTLGTKQDLGKFFRIAKEYQATTIADCCQSFLDSVSLKALHADALVCSSHKMYGPSGVGCLVTTSEFLESLPCYQTGGGMIQYVTRDHSLFLTGPARFEAGTPNIEGVVGFAAALEYLKKLDREEAYDYYDSLVRYGLEQFRNLGDYELLASQNAHRAAIFSFSHPKIHAHDLSTYLDSMHGICARAGHHCTMPLLEALGKSATIRFSFSLYNTLDEIRYCAEALRKAEEFFNV